MKREKLALYGTIIAILGVAVYLFGVVVAIPRRLLFNFDWALKANEFLVWYSGIPLLLGVTLVLIDLFVLFPRKRTNDFIQISLVENTKLTVTLTAYNDEKSIGLAVEDFAKHPLVERVIVVSNNSSDGTFEVAERAGAIVFNETTQGYGACVHRALSEAIKFSDTELIVLCEGDMTFSSFDIDKLLSFSAHADIVNGTRIVEQLRDKETQLSIFMFYGNWFVAKLLEVKHLGNVTLTDVGSTYKLCRRSALERLLPLLNNKVNLEFNPYLIDKALENQLKIIECPITFRKRIGESKGGNINNWVAMNLGFRMMRGILIDWKDQ